MTVQHKDGSRWKCFGGPAGELRYAGAYVTTCNRSGSVGKIGSLVLEPLADPGTLPAPVFSLNIRSVLV